MRLPLLFGADPRVVKEGPKVRLDEGRWRVVLEDVLNSRLGLHDSSSAVRSHYIVLNGTRTIELEGPTTAHVKVLVPGHEPFISVYAEYIP